MIKSIISKITDDINYDESGPFVMGYLNIYNYMVFRKSPELTKQISAFTLDGIFMVYFLQFVFRKKFSRKSPDFSSYFVDLFSQYDANKQSMFVVGGAPDECDAFCQMLSDDYSGINLVGKSDGFQNDDTSLFAKIKSVNPMIVIVGMGTPKQEQFAVDLKASGYEGVIYCCGALISQTAVQGQFYYPNWISATNLRWLYRIKKDPKLFKRYAFDYPKGLFYLLCDSRADSKLSVIK